MDRSADGSYVLAADEETAMRVVARILEGDRNHLLIRLHEMPDLVACHR